MLTSVWSRDQKWWLRIGLVIWIITVIIFYIWWLNNNHIGNLSGFIATTAVISWPLILFGYSFFFLLKMKKINDQRPLPDNLRVALIVTKAPSEPFPLIQQTLLSALKQKYPHDTWIADEDPTTEALVWYQNNNIKVSTRKDDPNYHNDTWPRKKKTKEGNLAYFYDKYGYEQYDIVVQIDADHNLNENYLEYVLRPFNDPKVGYVAAPSMGDLNFQDSWAARARVHAEAIFHGPMQSGATDKWVPLCIGSHYAVRTKALKEIGGIGPELAEDYSTTLMLSAQGWKGAWAYQAEAHGLGPNSFSALITQDYQWSRSIMIIFTSLFPKLFTKLNWRQKIHFLITQLWYPISGVIWLTSLIIILSTILIGHPAIIVPFSDFLLYVVPPFSLIIIIYQIIKQCHCLRPNYGNFLAWENILFEFARWPWNIVACIEGIVYSLRKKFSTENIITSKNKPAKEQIPLRYILPYLTIVFIFVLTLIIGHKTIDLLGYYVFAFIIVLIYLTLPIIILSLHIIESKYENKLEFTTNHVPHITSTASSSIAVLLTLVIIAYQFIIPLNAGTIIFPEIKKPDYADLQITTEVFPEKNASKTIHTVIPGDCLWRLAEKYYGDGKKWPEIYQANKELIDNPDLIYPEQKFIIPSF